MGKQVIPDGVYSIMGPGGQLTASGGRITMQEPGSAPPPLQLWEADFDKGSYTLRSIGMPLFVGTDGDPNEPNPWLTGSRRPFAWTLADGPDGDPNTFRVTSAGSDDNLQLVPSPLRMWPPMAGLLPGLPMYEWAFTPAG
jgi:hypothetical protein